MVGLDVTNTVRLTHAFADRFKAKKSNDVSQFGDQVFDNNRWFIESEEYYFWDVLAVIISANPELCIGEAVPVTGVFELSGESPYTKTSDLTMPELNASGKPRQHIKAATAGQVITVEKGALTKICTETDADKVFTMFIETLNNRFFLLGASITDSVSRKRGRH